MTSNLNKLTLNQLKRKLYLKFFLRNKLFLYLIKSEFVYKLKQLVIHSLRLLFKVTKTKQNAVCILSGRTYAVSKSLKISRFKSRLLINSGLVAGYSRVSW